MSAIQVKNISKETTEAKVRDFFSFCGKISSLTLTPGEGNTQEAVVTFEKETAAKTALLLDNTQLDTTQVQVTSAPGSGASEKASSSEDTKEHEEISQDEKPRSRVLAEYLAHGYTISDKVIERAIDMDKQHGYSTKFQQTLKSYDERFKATERAQNIDKQYNVSGKGWSAWLGLSSYFEKALGTPTGQKVRAFYEQGNKQVLDVHNEARHLADLKKKADGSTDKPAAGEASVEKADPDAKEASTSEKPAGVV